MNSLHHKVSRINGRAVGCSEPSMHSMECVLYEFLLILIFRVDWGAFLRFLLAAT
jgi:hypothetical protein